MMVFTLPFALYIAVTFVFLTLLLPVVGGIILHSSTLICTLLLGVFSLIMALLYLLMDAPDVAITEASVGVCITTALILLLLKHTKQEKMRRFKISWPALSICILVSMLLAYCLGDAPPYGSATAPIHQHVAPQYIMRTGNEIGVPAVVTAILASYRGYDTLGETVVIVTAALCVIMLLNNGKREG